MANVQTTYSTGRLNSFTIGGNKLEDEKVYTLVTINFLALGGDNFLSDVNFESVLYIDKLLRDVFIDEIRKKDAQGIEIESLRDNRVIISPTP